VPRDGLAAFAVGMERFQATLEAELDGAARGRGAFKAVRGEYGSGKTFFARWLQERAGFATSEVQVSETETPLHRWEAVYRRLIERLATSDTPDGAPSSMPGSTRSRRKYSARAGPMQPMPPRLSARPRCLWSGGCQPSRARHRRFPPYYGPIAEPCLRIREHWRKASLPG
jgi:hypothetical protein